MACWGEPSVVLTVTEIPVPMPSRFGPALSTPWIVRVLTLPTVEMVTLPELPPALVPPLESGFPFWVQEKVVPTPDGLAVTENGSVMALIYRDRGGQRAGDNGGGRKGQHEIVPALTHAPLRRASGKVREPGGDDAELARVGVAAEGARLAR